MSDLMLLGVLRMPLDTTSDLMMEQFINRARQAADRIESDAEQIDRERSYSTAMEARVSELERQLEQAQTRNKELAESCVNLSCGLIAAAENEAPIKAIVLRKQAEAVEGLRSDIYSDFPDSYAVQRLIEAMDLRSQRLRQQADEIEKAGGGQ